MSRRKPCPFCGGTNLADGEMLDGGPVVVCLTCYAAGPEGDSKRDAARKWNRREEKSDG